MIILFFAFLSALTHAATDSEKLKVIERLPRCMSALQISLNEKITVPILQEKQSPGRVVEFVNVSLGNGEYEVIYRQISQKSFAKIEMGIFETEGTDVRHHILSAEDYQEYKNNLSHLGWATLEFKQEERIAKKFLSVARLLPGMAIRLAGRYFVVVDRQISAGQMQVRVLEFQKNFVFGTISDKQHVLEVSNDEPFSLFLDGRYSRKRIYHLGQVLIRIYKNPNGEIFRGEIVQYKSRPLETVTFANLSNYNEVLSK